MSRSAGRCPCCCAPRDHPTVICGICGRTFSHIPALHTHAARDADISGHGLPPRLRSLLVERALFAIRGWPAPPIAPELARLIGPRLASSSRVTTPADAAGTTPSAASVRSPASDSEIEA